MSTFLDEEMAPQLMKFSINKSTLSNTSMLSPMKVGVINTLVTRSLRIFDDEHLEQERQNLLKNSRVVAIRNVKLRRIFKMLGSPQKYVRKMKLNKKWGSLMFKAPQIRSLYLLEKIRLAWFFNPWVLLKASLNRLRTLGILNYETTFITSHALMTLSTLVRLRVIFKLGSRSIN